MIKVKIEGAKDIEKALARLGNDKTTINVLRRSLYFHARIIRDAARRMAPVATGLLRRRIGISRRAVRRGLVRVQVKSRAPHSHLVEQGTAPRRQKNGRFTGQVTARPFMRPAWLSTKDTALDAIIKQVWDNIKKESSKR
jgi:HK97 gp10 family phage protein